MTEPDTLLSGLWAEDEAPARDPAFVATTMTRVARRRFQLALVALLAPTVALGVVLWSAAPALAGLFAGLDLAVVAPAAVALTLAGLIGLDPRRA